jgi:hypothetical protein
MALVVRSESSEFMDEIEATEGSHAQDTTSSTSSTVAATATAPGQSSGMESSQNSESAPTQSSTDDICAWGSQAIGKTPAASPNRPNASGKVAPVPPLPDNRSKAKGKGSGSGGANKEQLPVAELILSAHAVLFLRTLCHHSEGPSATGDDSDNSTINKPLTIKAIKSAINSTNTSLSRGKRETEHASSSRLKALAQRRSRQARRLLPRGSWWLPVRLLKAFLALQGQVR